MRRKVIVVVIVVALLLLLLVFGWTLVEGITVTGDISKCLGISEPEPEKNNAAAAAAVVAASPPPPPAPSVFYIQTGEFGPQTSQTREVKFQHAFTTRPFIMLSCFDADGYSVNAQPFTDENKRIISTVSLPDKFPSFNFSVNYCVNKTNASPAVKGHWLAIGKIDKLGSAPDFLKTQLGTFDKQDPAEMSLFFVPNLNSPNVFISPFNTANGATVPHLLTVASDHASFGVNYISPAKTNAFNATKGGWFAVSGSGPAPIREKVEVGFFEPAAAQVRTIAFQNAFLSPPVVLLSCVDDKRYPEPNRMAYGNAVVAQLTDVTQRGFTFSTNFCSNQTNASPYTSGSWVAIGDTPPGAIKDVKPTVQPTVQPKKTVTQEMESAAKEMVSKYNFYIEKNKQWAGAGSCCQENYGTGKIGQCGGCPFMNSPNAQNPGDWLDRLYNDYDDAKSKLKKITSNDHGLLKSIDDSYQISTHGYSEY